MKSALAFTIIFMLSCVSSANAANDDDGYMKGHPSYNQGYYSPNYSSTPSSPNSDANYYNRTYNQDRDSQSQKNSAPHGNDIRDYNPYYDRDGNLK